VLQFPPASDFITTIPIPIPIPTPGPSYLSTLQFSGSSLSPLLHPLRLTSALNFIQNKVLPLPMLFAKLFSPASFLRAPKTFTLQLGALHPFQILLLFCKAIYILYIFIFIYTFCCGLAGRQNAFYSRHFMGRKVA